MKAEGVTSKSKKKTEEKKKIGSMPGLVRTLSACHVLSGPGSTSPKQGVKHEDAESVTHAKRGARAKRTIQQKHTLSLQHVLSARSERA